MSVAPPVELSENAAKALVGAERSGSASAELLRSAAVAGLKSRAGWKPRRGVARVQPCPSDELPVCSPGAGAILARIAADADWELSREWAALAFRAGRRVPDSLVPAVFDAFVTRRGFATEWTRPLGRVGAWLASMNPEWGRVKEEDLERIEREWSTGTGSERRAWLRQVRERAPEKAAALISQTWGDDGADDRREFIEALAVGLSPADEPVLTRALGDRAKSVRDAAAALLAKVPSSEFVRRMTARAAGMVKVTLKGKNVTLEVEPPTELEEAWEADGIERKPPGGVGKRAWWLRQVLAMVPPSVWTQGGASADAVIKAADGQDYEKDLQAGWLRAAVASADVEWCLALARHICEKPKATFDTIAELWLELGGPGQEVVVSGVLEARGSHDDEVWATLGSMKHRWSAGFSTRAVARLARARVRPNALGLVWNVIGPIAEHVDVGSAKDLEAVCESIFSRDIPPSVAKALTRLSVRVEMHKEFNA
jgi:hypothetical protein